MKMESAGFALMKRKLQFIFSPTDSQKKRLFQHKLPDRDLTEVKLLPVLDFIKKTGVGVLL